MIWIIIYVLTVILSVILHLSVGYMIKRRFKILDKSQELENFQDKFKQKEGTFKRWSKYIIFLVPILNILISCVEISHKEKSIAMILKEIDKMKLSSNSVKTNDEEITCDYEDEKYKNEKVEFYHGEDIDFSEDYKIFLESRANESQGGPII